MTIELRNLRCTEYATIADAAFAYLDQVAQGNPCQAAISIASPMTGCNCYPCARYYIPSVIPAQAGILEGMTR